MRAAVAANVVLGFDRLEPYLDSSPYFGAVVGRYANRIAHARFAIDGREHRVSANEPPNHLHGGFKGFDKRVWDAEAPAMAPRSYSGGEVPTAKKGIPGTLDVQVTYTVADRDLRIEYQAVADAPTHVNLTQHSYFNLRGTGDVLSHCLAINASTYLPVDERLIPTGELAPVANTPFDFQESTAIGLRLHADHEQLTRGGGYDHTFNLNRAGLDAGACGARARPVERAHARGAHDRAGTAVLFGPGGRAPRLLPRAAALSRLAEPPGVSVDVAAAGRALSVDDAFAELALRNQVTLIR